MPRLPRYAIPGQPQHVVQRGNDRRPMFASDDDYAFFLACVGDACERHGCTVHAYVLMTNHIHLVATPRTAVALGKVMQRVGSLYVPYFNRRTGRTGALWEGRYRATVIDTERYLLNCHRYVELNPVRAGMVADPASHPWSSHAANAFGLADTLIEPHDVYRALGRDDRSRREAYRALFRDALADEAIRAIRAATHGGWALGDEAFRERMCAESGRRAAPRRRGRCMGSDAIQTNSV